MQELLFASSNSAKIRQFQFVADAHGYKCKIVSVYERYPNIKSYGEEYDSQYEIIDNGSREIYKNLGRPVIVEDTILEVAGLGGLPGLRSSEYLKRHGREGMLREVKKLDREASIISIAGFYDGNTLVSCKTVVAGHIPQQEQFLQGEPDWIGPSDNNFGGGFNAIFYSKAAKTTLANMTAKDGLRYGYREPNFKLLLQMLCG